MDIAKRKTMLDCTYAKAGNIKTSYFQLELEIERAFDGLSAREKKQLCEEFGISIRPKSGKHAMQLVRRRIVERLESINRIQF